MKTKIFIILTFITIVIAAAFAQNLRSDSAELPDEVKNWELMSEKDAK